MRSCERQGWGCVTLWKIQVDLIIFDEIVLDTRPEQDDVCKKSRGETQVLFICLTGS